MTLSIRSACAAGVLVLAAACASKGPAPTAPVVAPKPPVAQGKTATDLALETARKLADAGNEQIAIDRLTQELGNPKLTEAERATLYLERGKLRVDGNNVRGAIADFAEAVRLAPDTATGAQANAQLQIAQSKADALAATLGTGELSRSERFETLFELGQHEDAMDLLLEGGVTPSPDTLLDMYQIGYLCDGAAYTGPAWDIVEPDGTARTVRFCDFGK